VAAGVAPKIEETSVAEGDVVGRIDAQTGGGAVNPIRGAFELGIVADGGFIDHAMASPSVHSARHFS